MVKELKVIYDAHTAWAFDTGHFNKTGTVVEGSCIDDFIGYNNIPEGESQGKLIGMTFDGEASYCIVYINNISLLE